VLAPRIVLSTVPARSPRPWVHGRGLLAGSRATPQTRLGIRSNSWAFFQLRMFVLYKGIKFGVAVHLVDPRYTSKSCHHCKVLGNRQGKKFSCLNLACGWVGDADLNGANNISELGALINCPGGSSTMFCYEQDVVLRAAENLVCAPAQAG